LPRLVDPWGDLPTHVVRTKARDLKAGPVVPRRCGNLFCCGPFAQPEPAELLDVKGWGSGLLARQLAEIAAPQAPVRTRYALMAVRSDGVLVTAGARFGEKRFPTAEVARTWAHERGLVLISRPDRSTDR